MGLPAARLDWQAAAKSFLSHGWGRLPLHQDMAKTSESLSGYLERTDMLEKQVSGIASVREEMDRFSEGLGGCLNRTETLEKQFSDECLERYHPGKHGRIHLIAPRNLPGRNRDRGWYVSYKFSENAF